MEFKQSVKEALAYYIYALVDPRDQKIFYIGKGKDNRVFQHAKATIDEIEQGLKLETIKVIISEGKQVEYYILRHNLDEKEAYLVESAIIDMLTYYKFNHHNQLTNIVAGHHQWDEGIKSIEEINALYDCPKLKKTEITDGVCILLVSLNRTYNQTRAKGIYQRFNIYEATRKYWAISSRQAERVNYVLGVYKGVVRCVIKVNSHEFVDKSNNGIVFKKPRCCFEGEQCLDSIYLNKDVTDYPFGSGGSVRYLG